MFPTANQGEKMKNGKAPLYLTVPLSAQTQEDLDNLMRVTGLTSRSDVVIRAVQVYSLIVTAPAGLRALPPEMFSPDGYELVPCDFAACEPGGEPCSVHERLWTHHEGDHELCGAECADDRCTCDSEDHTHDGGCPGAGEIR
jgi:hypothetical protein